MGTSARVLSRLVRSIQRRAGTTSGAASRARIRGGVMSCPPGTRVMMTADAVGGVWTFAAHLAVGLGAAGFEVALVTLGPRPVAAQRAMVAGSPGVSLI